MRHIPLPELPHIERYYHYARAFSPPECDELIRLAENQAMAPGSIGIGMGQQPQVDMQYRMVHTARIHRQAAPWAFDKLIEKIVAVNTQWNFNLQGLYEDIGVMRYLAPHDGQPAGHYRWHQDFGGGKFCQRKISIVGLLSEPAAFRGGDLRIFADRGEERASLNERGDLVLFPSWTPHCVADVTEGVRYSLVAWVSGERFR